MSTELPMGKLRLARRLNQDDITLAWEEDSLVLRMKGEIVCEWDEIEIEPNATILRALLEHREVNAFRIWDEEAGSGYVSMFIGDELVADWRFTRNGPVGRQMDENYEPLPKVRTPLMAGVLGSY